MTQERSSSAYCSKKGGFAGIVVKSTALKILSTNHFAETCRLGWAIKLLPTLDFMFYEFLKTLKGKTNLFNISMRFFNKK